MGRGRKSSTKTDLVDKALEKIGKKLEERQFKGTVSDLIRIVGLKKEIDEAAGTKPVEIKVTWVDTGSASEK